MICPRSAILQSAAASMVDGILEVTVSTAERIATRGVPSPTCDEQVDGVLHDVALGVEIRENVDGRVGDEQRLRIGRHIHDEDMADPPCRAQAGRVRRPRASARRCAGCPSSGARPCLRGSAHTALAAAASLCGDVDDLKALMSSSMARAQPA